ncbi:uncharacterized protein ARMOST_18108 [Armillaria ostoyae]|uniref:Uncharacterized protein n=1 Tax=Armillaria ostoyae TaxID=47428 RepID=A0A284S0X2_ARMOS|nr:uncharacterized protein ARMOST_18108 [Armillaria ostoyae]
MLVFYSLVPQDDFEASSFLTAPKIERCELQQRVAIRQVARPRRERKDLFVALDTDGSAWRGGRRLRRDQEPCHLLHNDCAPSAEAGGRVCEDARPYPHDSLTLVVPSHGRQWYVEGKATEGRVAHGDAYTQRTYQAFPNTKTASSGMPREDYRFVSGWWCSLQDFVYDVWRPATNIRRTMATQTGWRALLSTLSTLFKTRLSRAVQPAYPSDIVAVVCPIFMPLSAFRIPAPYLPLAAL